MVDIVGSGTVTRENPKYYTSMLEYVVGDVVWESRADMKPIQKSDECSISVPGLRFWQRGS